MKYIYRIFFTVLVFGAGQIIFGQSYQELQRFQEEYKKVLELQALQKPADISEAEKTASSTALPDKLIYSRKYNKGVIELNRLRGYGVSAAFFPLVTNI